MDNTNHQKEFWLRQCGNNSFNIDITIQHHSRVLNMQIKMLFIVINYGR